MVGDGSWQFMQQVHVMVSHFSSYSDQIPDKKQFKRRGIYLDFQLEGSCLSQCRGQEQEVDSPMVSGVRKKQAPMPVKGWDCQPCEGKQARSKSFLFPCTYIDFQQKVWLPSSRCRSKVCLPILKVQTKVDSKQIENLSQVYPPFLDCSSFPIQSS